jgi:O-antigen ligase
LTKDISPGVFAVASVPVLFCLVALAYVRPGYFTSQTYLAGLIVLEVLALALWRFRQVFFPLLLYVFLSAGSELPGNSFGAKGRWVFLAIGALIGVLISLKQRELHFGFFHLISLCCVLTALVSAAVSRYPNLAALKALSLFLLFVYAATGARMAVEGRENRFLEGLLVGCEFLVLGTAACYAAGIELMGNPNSLGAIMGVVGTPLLLWGMLVSKNKWVRRRRQLVFGICVYLVYYSHARAAMLAAAVTCALFCVCVREYKMLIQGLGIMVIAVTAAFILQPQAASNSVSVITADVVYKGHGQGMLSSRQSPWNEAMSAISSHFWFGTGFGTKDTAFDSTMPSGTPAADFARAEYGSSYLTVVVWVGVIGTLPFLLLLVLVAGSAVRTLRWMRATRSALHPAVPLTLVIVAGLIHCGLEDWLFAVGYYLCVFFWSMAFVLVDIAPVPLRASGLSTHFRIRSLQRTAQSLIPGRN